MHLKINICYIFDETSARFNEKSDEPNRDATLLVEGERIWIVSKQCNLFSHHENTYFQTLVQINQLSSIAQLVERLENAN